MRLLLILGGFAVAKVKIKFPERAELSARLSRRFLVTFCAHGKDNQIECLACPEVDCCLCTEYAAAALDELESFASLQLETYEDYAEDSD